MNRIIWNKNIPCKEETKIKISNSIIKSRRDENSIYYIYLYLDPRKLGKYNYENLDQSFLYEPFYVGMGKNNRYLSHMKVAKRSNSRTLKNQKIRKILKLNLEPIILKVKKNLFRKEAYKLEMKYIKSIGRKDLNLGPLCNMTNGGDGSSGHIMSDKNKIRVSKQWKGRKLTKEHMEKLIKINTGRKHSDETKKKISELAKGRIPWNAKKYLFYSPDNIEFYFHGKYKDFLLNNKLNLDCLKKVARDELKFWHNWDCYIIDHNLTIEQARIKHKNKL